MPIVMAAEIMMGIYFNLSFWYKIIDKTIWGAVFSITGCTVLVAVNVIFIPRYSYMACAWGGFAGYAVAMLFSYLVGQKLNPIDYDIKGIMRYVVLAAVLYVAMVNLPSTWPIWARMALNTGLITIFLIEIFHRDMKLSSLPIVGKYFRSKQCE